VDRVLWGKVREYATVLDANATSDLSELALRILVALLDSKQLPGDLAELLRSRDPRALAQLSLYIEKLRILGSRAR